MQVGEQRGEHVEEEGEDRERQQVGPLRELRVQRLRRVVGVLGAVGRLAKLVLQHALGGRGVRLQILLQVPMSEVS